MGAALYILGNGFDLHHGIASSYKAFGEYLKSNARSTYRVVEQYFDVDEQFWADFEARLASIDIDTLTDDASEFLVNYGADDWSDSYHHDYQYEIGQVVETISKTMRARFGDWIRQLCIPKPSKIAGWRLSVDPSATFLNFNYTPSLQRLYGVCDSHIFHIHGAATDPDASLILGHGWQPEAALDPYRFERVPESADMRLVEGQSIIDRYFKDTFKPTADVIRDSAPFFARLANVEQIFVMGHSVSEVDHPYFREVIRNIDVGRTRWKVSYFDDLPALQKRVDAVGILPHRVEFAPLAEFCEQGAARSLRQRAP